MEMKSEAKTEVATQTFGKRLRLKAGTYLIIGISSLLALVLMINYLSSQYYTRFFLEQSRSEKLSAQTVRILKTLTNQVSIMVFFDPEEDETLYHLVTSLVRELAHATPYITYRFVNPARQPAEAERILANYKLSSLKHRNFVVVEADRRTKLLFANELGEYRIDILPQTGKAVAQYRRKLLTFRGEQLIAEAIFSLTHPISGKVYFLQGHGEHDPELIEHPHGYSKLAEMLSQALNIAWQKLWLTSGIPSDCSLLIIAGARLPLSSAEIEQLDTYLKNGGRALILLPTMAIGDDSRIDSLLIKWGINAPKKIVFDPQFSPTGSDVLTAGLNGEHQITRSLLADTPDIKLRLVLPRPVQLLSRTGTSTPDKPQVVPLLFTSEQAYEASTSRAGVPERNPLQDRQGRFSLAVAVEYGTVKGITTERGVTRMVVVGDSLFLDNELIDSPPANRQFAWLAINWLLVRPSTIFEGIWATPVKEYILLLTPAQQNTLKWLFLVIVPGVFVVMGSIINWWRR
jgi:hypothetical protein